jgi:excisionase family DNA binding protein
MSIHSTGIGHDTPVGPTVYKYHPVEPPPWVRPAEAQRLLGCGQTTIYKWIKEGILESRKIGRNRLIARSSIDTIGQPAKPHPAATEG